MPPRTITRFCGWDPEAGCCTEAEVDPQRVEALLDAVATEAEGENDLLRFGDLADDLFRAPVDVSRWAAVVLEDDLDRAAEALEPLLAHRAERGELWRPAEPLKTSSDEAVPAGIIPVSRVWSKQPYVWEERLREAVEPNPLPMYLMLVGGPDRLPFGFQFFLDREYYTGRLDVGPADNGELSWGGCRAYAEKVVRYERGELPVQPTALVYSFANDEATGMSHEVLAEPLVAHLAEAGAQSRMKIRFSAAAPLLMDDATTDRLCAALTTERFGLVFTMSHGIEKPPQRERWGALTDATHLGAGDWIPLAADTVPSDGPFAPGAVFFSFACFSAGVPERSAFNEIMGEVEAFPDAPFTSPLPRTLLAMPQGPVGFVGHVDRATDLSYSSEDREGGLEPFCNFIYWTLGGNGTLAQGMRTFREILQTTSATISMHRSSLFPGRGPGAAVMKAWWEQFHDFMGYMILGDPAIRLAMGIKQG